MGQKKLTMVTSESELMVMTPIETSISTGIPAQKITFSFDNPSAHF